jgi:DNA-binding beta-propeller fold protein YncE
MRKYIFLILLSLLANGQFFEGYIPLPENSPGVGEVDRLVYNWVNNILYVSGCWGEIAFLNGTDLSVRRIISLNSEMTNRVMFWFPENNRVYIPSSLSFTSHDEYFLVFDGENGDLLDTLWVKVSGLYPQRMVYNPNNNRIYINEYRPPFEGHIVVADGRNHTILDTLETFGSPFYLALNPVNNHLYASCLVQKESLGQRYEHFCLNIFDCETNQLIDTTIKGDLFTLDWPDGDLLYNPLSNKIYFDAHTSLLVIDCSQDSVIAEFEGLGDSQLLLNFQENKVYTSSGRGDSPAIFIVDCERDSIIKVIRNRKVDFYWEWFDLAVYNPINNKVYLATTSGADIEYITIIDGESDSIVAEIPLLSPGFNFAMCCDRNHNRIYCAPNLSWESIGLPYILVIDGESNQILDTIVVGTWLGGTTIWNPLNNKLYLTTYKYFAIPDCPGSIVVIDGSTHRVIREIGVDWTPAEFTVNTRWNKVYCILYNRVDEDGAIAVIDGERDTIRTLINLGYFPGGLTYNSTNDKVYCANFLNGVAVVDGQADTIITFVQVPFYPGNVIWHPTLNKVYCGEGDLVGVIDGSTNQLLKVVPGPPYSQVRYALNLRDNKLYITYAEFGPGGGLGIFDCLSDTFIRFYEFRDGCVGVAWAERENKIYFSYWEQNTTGFGVLDGETDSIIRIIQTDVDLYDMLWNPYNNKIYAASTPGGVAVIDCETDSILEVSNLSHYNWGYQPLALNLDNRRIYLASEDASRVFVFRGDSLGILTEPSEKRKDWLRLYPNPARSLLNVFYSLPEGEEGKLEIYDCAGRLLKKVSPLRGSGVYILHLNGNREFRISPGVYFLRFETRKENITKKFVWQRGL